MISLQSAVRLRVCLAEIYSRLVPLSSLRTRYGLINFHHGCGAVQLELDHSIQGR